MTIRQKILLGAATLYVLGGAAAYAEVNLDVNLGAPAYPAYVATPAYVSPYPGYYDPHHRGRDFGYWRAHRGEVHADRGHWNEHR